MVSIMKHKFERRFESVCNHCKKPFTFAVDMKDIKFKGTVISVPAYKDQFRRYCSAKCFGKHILHEISVGESLIKKMQAKGFKVKVCVACGNELPYKCVKDYKSCPCVLYNCPICGYQNCDKIEMHSFDIDEIKKRGGYANLYEEIVDYVRIR